MLDNVTVFTQNSIRIEGEKIFYFDPFYLEVESHDADAVFITHDHYDHFSPKDFRKVARPDTVFVVPEKLVDATTEAGISREHLVPVKPAQQLEVLGQPIETVPSYNLDKEFHPRQNGWVGYLVTLSGVRYYIAGDTDDTPEAEQVDCDVAFLPIGGTYTMNAVQAAHLANAMRPHKAVVPTHFGSIVGDPADADTFAAHVDPDLIVVRKIAFE